MNGLLQLKGRFEKRGNEGMGPVTLPAHKKVTSEHIEKLIVQLSKVKAYWSDKDDIAGMIECSLHSCCSEKQSIEDITCRCWKETSGFNQRSKICHRKR